MDSDSPAPISDDDEPIVIRTDTIAARLLPAFLSRRAKDLALIDLELARDGFRAIERVGHNLKGVGRSYGLDGVSEIGALIEEAGQQRDAGEIRRQTAMLTRYLQRIRL